MNTPRPRQPKRLRSGFTLLEIMCVMIIMAAMLALVGPSVANLTSRLGRQSAISTMMGTLEQARVAALFQGVPVHVAFAANGFPDQYRFRSFRVLRERLDDDPPSVEFIPLTRWVALPRGVSFVNETNSLLGAPTITLTPDLLPPGVSATNVPSVVFNPSGFIDTDSSKLRLMIYEGFDLDGKPNFSRRDRAFMDVITLRRYTGRAELFLASTAP